MLATYSRRGGFTTIWTDANGTYPIVMQKVHFTASLWWISLLASVFLVANNVLGSSCTFGSLIVHTAPLLPDFEVHN